MSRKSLTRVLPPAHAIGRLMLVSVIMGQIAGSAQAQDGYRIAGTVVNTVSGSPLARARVTIYDVRNPRNLSAQITSEDGHFDFTQLPAGKYSLQGEKRGFIGANYEQHEQFSSAIVTGADIDTEHLMLRLAPYAVLSGKVLDEAGEPVRQATVALYREDRRTGIGRTQKIRQDNTDDQGFYEFTPLVGGIYYLSVTAKPWYGMHLPAEKPDNVTDEPRAVDRSLDVAYPMTYYKDATEADDASPIPIRGGDHLQIDLTLNPVPALRLLFRVPDQGRYGVNQPSLQKPSFDGLESLPNSGIEMVSPGLFAIDGVPAGHYEVRSFGRPGQDPPSEVDIDVSEDGQELDTSKASPTSTVQATVQLQGEEHLKQMFVILRNSKMRVVGARIVDEKGEIEFNDLAPGRYEVLAQTSQKAYAVLRISTANGGATDGNRLDVAPGATLNVTLTVVGSTVSVQGFVKRKGQGIAGAMVVLVPKDPGSNRQLFRRDQSDLDGSFSLQGVISGTYTIVAIENGWDLDWSSPGVIAHYCDRGRAVKIADVNRGSVSLPEAIELQPR